MKTLYTIYTSFAKRLALVLTLITLGVTSAWAQEEELVYTLDGTVKDGNNDYTKESTITQSDISWSITGNTQMAPWRIGGKSLTKVDRAIYSTTDIDEDISKIVITHGGASSITVNSMTVIVSTLENGGGTVISTLTPTFKANGDVTITRPDGKDWSNAFYKIVYNVTVSGDKNKFIEFTSAKFYKTTAPSTFTVTCEVNEETPWGTLSSTDPISGLASGTSISAEGNVLTIGETEITATPNAQDANYTYAFKDWSGIPDGGKVTENVTVTANFTRTARDLTNYRTSCTTETIVTLDPNGGTISNTDGWTDNRNGTYSKTHEGTEIALPTATKTNYIFDGWHNGETKYESIPSDLDESITLTAKWLEKQDAGIYWDPESVTVTIDADGNILPEFNNPNEIDGIEFSSSNPSVVAVDANGVITLGSTGTTATVTITATFDGDATYAAKEATCTLTVHPSNCRWVETEIEDIDSGDEVVVMMAHGTNLYALPYDKETAGNSNPAATTITLDDFAGTISGTLIWYIEKDHESHNFTLSPKTATDKYLTCNSSNNAVRINTGANRNFTIENDFLKNTAFSTYLAISTTATPKDWRHFGSTNTTISSKAQTLKFYKKTCLPADEYWINYNLSNVTCITNPKPISVNSSDSELRIFFEPVDGYQLPKEIEVKMGEQILNEELYTWDNTNGKFVIESKDISFVGDVTISIIACKSMDNPADLSTNVTSTTATLSWSTVENAQNYTLLVISDDDDISYSYETTLLETTCLIEGLTPNTTYLWEVVANGVDGYCDTHTDDIFTTLDVYTVTFNTDGGTAVESQTVDHGSKATKPANPTKTGYTFAGWYTEADAEFDFNTPITSATTLYAKWNANQYTITFLKQYGSGGTDNATVTFNSNNFSVGTIELPTRDRYEFGGYYTETGGAGLQIVDAEGKWLKNKTGYLDASGNWIKAASVNLYAKWTKIHTITWVVNNNTETPHYTSMVLDGNTIDELPNAPADDLFEDCDVNAFVGWSTDNIGFNPDPTAPTDLFKTVAEAQNKIGAISADKKFYAVYASEVEQIATFEADGLNGLSANSTLKWTHDNSGISLAISAGQRYTGSPKTFTITNGTSNYCEIVAPEGKSLKKAVVSITESEYKVNSVSSPWSLSTSSTTQTITTSTNATDLKMYATSSYQIRITQVDVTYTTYSNYITRCTALPDPVWGGATIDKTEIAVNCGETSSTTGAAKISFLKETNYNLYKDITVEVTSGNFIIASSRNGEYSTSVTLTPTQSGTNVGTLDGKYVYVRAVAPAMSDEDFTGTITISGKQLAQDQVIEVTAEVSCTQYTLTFYDQGQTKTVEGFAGTSVVAPEPWAETCSEPFQYVFDGWAKAPVTNGTEEYDKVDFSTFTMPNNNTTILYAVYRYAEEGGEPVNGFVKVTEALADWSGDYVIVDDEFNVAIQNTYEEDTKDNKTLKDVSVTIKNDKIVSPTNDIIWTISKYGEYYTVYNAEAIKYAGITKNETRAAGLSETIATGYSMNIIFDSNTKIAKVSSTNYNRCFSYSESYPEWRTYSNNDANGKTGYLYRLSNKTIRYTSSLVCRTIEAKDAIVTSTVGQIVKVNVPITLGYSGAASITGTSDNEAFTVVTKNDVAVGESNIEVHYKPTAYVNTANQEETATITLTTSNAATTTFNITGRCLPETFAIVAKVGNIWYALPSQGLNSGTTPVGYPVEVDNNDNPTAVTSVPANADWSLRQVYASSESNDRFADNGEKLVFVNDANPQKALNAGSTGNYLLTDAQYDDYHNTTTPGLYEWTPTTTDLETYQLTNEQRSRTLSVNTATVFGVHSDNKATTEVRFLPIQNRYTPAALQVVEWKENSVVIMYNGDPAQTASVSVNGAAAQNTTLSAAQRDIAVYELAATGLADNPTQRLSITIGSEKTILSIPYIISGTQTDYELLPGSSVSAKREAAKIADLIVLNAATLTAAGSKSDPYKFRNVTIYGGGSLVIPADKGFGANSLTMRVGGVEDGEYVYTYPQLDLNGTINSGNINLDLMTTYDYYYPFSVPYEVTLTDIHYPIEIYGSNVKLDNKGSFLVSNYDGEARAQGNTGWKDVEEQGKTVLSPHVGYSIWGLPKKVSVNGVTSDRQTYGIHRIPMKNSATDVMDNETKDQDVSISAYDAARDNDKGWNFIGNPYLVQHGGLDGSDADVYMGLLVKEMKDGQWTGGWVFNGEQVRYVTQTNDCLNYTSTPVADATIPAFSAFFIQAKETGAIAFTSPNVAAAQSLTARRSDKNKEITTGIILSGEKYSDRTGLLIAEEFTEAYEFNADLSKFDNQDMNLYTISPNGKLAFMAINEELAKQTIPLGYSVSADGMYSIAFDEQRYSRNDIYALYLIDYDRNETTNLLHMDYNFYSETGAHAERFALQVTFAPKTPTDVEYTQVGDVLLSREGNTLRLDNLPSDATVTVYDAVGHLVEQHTVSQLLQLTLQKGYYLLHIGNNQNSVVIDTFIP